MRIDFTKRFRKQYHALPAATCRHADERLALFAAEPFHPILNNHALHGEYAGCRSINVTGDYRAVFFCPDDETAVFVAIGTHHELFGS
jgi:addiction module RelE/StbE family toxin